MVLFTILWLAGIAESRLGGRTKSSCLSKLSGNVSAIGVGGLRASGLGINKSFGARERTRALSSEGFGKFSSCAEKSCIASGSADSIGVAREIDAALLDSGVCV